MVWLGEEEEKFGGKSKVGCKKRSLDVVAQRQNGTLSSPGAYVRMTQSPMPVLSTPLVLLFCPNLAPAIHARRDSEPRRQTLLLLTPD